MMLISIHKKKRSRANYIRCPSKGQSHHRTALTLTDSGREFETSHNQTGLAMIVVSSTVPKVICEMKHLNLSLAL